MAASEFRRLEERVRELERLLGRKTMEVEILREALDLVWAKTQLAVALAAEAFNSENVPCTLDTEIRGFVWSTYMLSKSLRERSSAMAGCHPAPVGRPSALTYGVSSASAARKQVCSSATRYGLLA